MFRTALVVVAVLVACQDSDPEHSAPPAPKSVPTQEAPPTFGLYMLALTWAPNFCCTHSNKEECSGLSDAFAGTHLTLHGLWPNYTDDEARTHGSNYPEFCGDYAHCKRALGGSCDPDPATIPDDMRDLGPGYVDDNEFLAKHEWPKHGSCTGLSAAAYFRAALDAMKALPGEGTPPTLRDAIGRELELDALQTAFGVPKTSVLLSCDASCALSQVSICLAHESNGLPGKPTPCPQNTVTARYDNGCVTRGCKQVFIGQADRCDRRKAPDGHGPARACTRPGQGPPCTSDDTCVQAGFLRCAKKSHCCTSQP